MKIQFVKDSGNGHSIEVRERRVGPDIRRPPRETGPTLPHDLAHAAVESVLQIDDGFWAAVDNGVTFDGFEMLQPGRHLRSGLKQMRRLGEREELAELKVSWAHRHWSGQRTSGPGLGDCPLTDDELCKTGPALEEAHRRWVALEEGESLDWRWAESE
jgi:hypothetical protein